MRRLRGRVRAAGRGARDQGHLQEARPGQAPALLLRRLRPDRRRARRGPHLHLLRDGGGRGPDQQLEGPRRDAGDLHRRAGPVPRLDARPHHVRRPVLHGPARLPALRAGRGDHRLRLRRRLHAHHDAHGPGRPRRAGRRRLLRQGRAHRRRPAGAGPGGRAVAVQPDQVHLPLPRVARDLVLRLRLRRQRPARQEVLRAADRLRHGARRGLARRAHADPQAHPAAGRVQVRRRRVPERLRQDQPRHAGAHGLRLDRGDHRRRHRLDALRRGRPPVRDQPRGRLLRRRARHGRAHQRQRDEDPVGQRGLHQRRAHRRRRRLVGGHDAGGAGPPDRLEGQRLDAGLRDPGRPPQRPLHRARFAVPDHRARVGGPQGRADLGDPLRRPACQRGAAGDRVLRLEPRRLPGCQRGLREDRRRRGQGRRTAPRPVRHAAVLRLQHGRLHGALDRRGQGQGPVQAAEDLLRQLVPQERRGHVRLARLRRELPRPEVDRGAPGRQGRGRRDPDRHPAGEVGPGHRRPRTLRRGAGLPAHGRQGGLARGGRADPRAPRHLRRPHPEGAVGPVPRARRAPGLSPRELRGRSD
ncbi:hypothetical protein SGPA1_12216 [Streptomyces misionensis JCM 4497]